MVMLIEGMLVWVRGWVLQSAQSETTLGLALAS
jgi:hypothetical protein